MSIVRNRKTRNRKNSLTMLNACRCVTLDALNNQLQRLGSDRVDNGEVDAGAAADSIIAGRLPDEQRGQACCWTNCG